MVSMIEHNMRYKLEVIGVKLNTYHLEFVLLEAINCLNCDVHGQQMYNSTIVVFHWNL